MAQVIAYDVGTTGVKTCLFSIGKEIRLVAGEYEGYDLWVLPNGGAEQDADQWWHAMCATTRRLLERTQIAYLRTGSVWEFYHPHGGMPSEMARKRAPWLLPCREYLGHNPLFAFARLLAGK